MTETLIVSGEPSSTFLRSIWLSVVSQTIASWGLLVSIFLPIVQQQPGPPDTIETYASRYRINTPEPARAKHHHHHKKPDDEVKKNREAAEAILTAVPEPTQASRPLRPIHQIRKLRKAQSFNRRSSIAIKSGYNTIANTFTSMSVRRSYSMTSCTDQPAASSSKNNNNDGASGRRPRAASDPTNGMEASLARAPIYARKCVTYASAVAVKSTAPARPIIKRTRTAIQRSLSTGEVSGNDNGLGDEPAGQTFLKAARTRTKHAINRSATVANSAFQKVTPALAASNKAVVYADADEDEKLGEGEGGGVVAYKEVEEITIVPAPVETDSRRRKVSTRRLTTFTRSRFFARFQT